ncbi:MAG: hypothetical protein ACR2PB_10770, partial [Desulfocapsaceae bacterium]
MKRLFKISSTPAVALSLLLLNSQIGIAEEDLAKQSQNPLGTIISLPFENNFYFGVGPSDKTGYGLTWKPVYPVSIGKWNLINRFIVPVMYSPGQDEDVLLDSSLEFGNASMTEL